MGADGWLSTLQTVRLAFEGLIWSLSLERLAACEETSLTVHERLNHLAK
jgi:hypothetical protein